MQTKLALLTLSLYLIALPLYEAPKHIFAALFILVSLGSANNWSNSRLGVSIVTLGGSVFLAGISSEFYSVPKIFSAISPLLVCVALVCNKSVVKHYQLILTILLLSCFIAILESFFRWLSPGWIVEYPTLRSVGHINQSALYVIFVMPLVLILLEMSENHNWLINMARICFSVICVIAFFFYLFAARSVLAFAGAGLILVFALFRNPSYFLSLLSLGFAFLVIGLLVVMLDVNLLNLNLSENILKVYVEVLDKLSWRTDDGFGRLSLWNSGLTVWLENPLFGSGVGSFASVVNSGNVLGLLEQGRTPFLDLEKLSFSSHGHSFYVTFLVERGLVGLACAIIPLGYVINVFFKQIRRDGMQKVDVCVYIGLISAALVLMLGVAQTTLSLEHGHVCVILITIGMYRQNIVSKGGGLET